MSTRRLLPFPLLLLTATLLVAAVTTSTSVGRAQESGSTSQIDEAKRHFKAGVSYLQDPEGERYEDAYAEFKKSYELSKSPRVLGNLALCAMKLERDGEAIDAYTRYIGEVADIDPEEREQVRRDLQTLSASAVHVTYKVSVANAILVDVRSPVRGANVTNSYPTSSAGPNKLVMRPGQHLMTLKVGGQAVARWEINAAAGQQLTHDFVATPDATTAPTPPPTERGDRPSKAGPIALIAVGLTALATGGVLGIVTLKKESDLEKQCPNDTCNPTARSDIGTGRDLARVTDFVLLGGGVLLVGGVVWWLLLPSKSSRAAAAATAAGQWTF